jgi:hypothetical protein
LNLEDSIADSAVTLVNSKRTTSAGGDPMPAELELTVTSSEVPALEREIKGALAAAGLPLDRAPWIYAGPPPGAFGFGEGVLKFLGSAWAELMKVPNAVEALARGIAAWMVQTRMAADVTVANGAISVRFRASGKAVDVDAVTRQLAAAIEHARDAGTR